MKRLVEHKNTNNMPAFQRNATIISSHTYSMQNLGGCIFFFYQPFDAYGMLFDGDYPIETGNRKGYPDGLGMDTSIPYDNY